MSIFIEIKINSIKYLRKIENELEYMAGEIIFYLWCFKGLAKSKHKLFCFFDFWLDLEHASFHPR